VAALSSAVNVIVVRSQSRRHLPLPFLNSQHRLRPSILASAFELLGTLHDLIVNSFNLQREVEMIGSFRISLE
jgi:hypothetical protein